MMPWTSTQYETALSPSGGLHTAARAMSPQALRVESDPAEAISAQSPEVTRLMPSTEAMTTATQVSVKISARNKAPVTGFASQRSIPPTAPTVIAMTAPRLVLKVHKMNTTIRAISGHTDLRRAPSAIRAYAPTKDAPSALDS